MIAVFEVEKREPASTGKASDNASWLPFAAISIEVPFNCSKYNFVLELVAALAQVLGRLGATEGTYRIGGDEVAIVEWNGFAPRLPRPIEPETDPSIAAARLAAESASKDSN